LRYLIQPSDKAIDDILNRCAEQEDKGGSAVPGMSYEQGVKAGIEWLITPDFEKPLE
jgi:hypothetical protein